MEVTQCARLRAATQAFLGTLASTHSTTLEMLLSMPLAYRAR